jgi:hypothetical protein
MRHLIFLVTAQYVRIIPVVVKSSWVFSPLPAFCCFFGLRFLVWIPSFRIASGRFTPCSLKYRPHALHTGSPSLLRRHSVVVRVPQLVQHRPRRRVAVCRHLKMTHRSHYSSRDQTVRFTYVTSVRVEEKKRIYYVNQRHYRHRNWASELQSTAAGK